MCLFSLRASEGNNVLRLGAFLAIRYGEFYLLAIGESFEAIAFDRAEMDKNIGSVFTLDKAEALGLVKPLNSACGCRHKSYLYC